jgi:hypothetical protein
MPAHERLELPAGEMPDMLAGFEVLRALHVPGIPEYRKRYDDHLSPQAAQNSTHVRDVLQAVEKRHRRDIGRLEIVLVGIEI